LIQKKYIYIYIFEIKDVLAQNETVLERGVEVRRESLADNSFDPFLSLLLQSLVVTWLALLFQVSVQT